MDGQLIGAVLGGSAGTAAIQMLVKWIGENGLNRRKRLSLEAAAAPAMIHATTERSTADDTQRLAMFTAQAAQQAATSAQVVECYRTINQMVSDSRLAAAECERRLVESDKRCADKLATMQSEIREERERRETLEQLFDEAEIKRAEERTDAGREADRLRVELAEKLRAREAVRKTSAPEMAAVKDPRREP